MYRNIRIFLSIAIYVLGFAVAIYIGGWVMLVKPIKGTIAAYTLGTLTLRQAVIALIKCICSLTVTGFIWCLGYIASNWIYDSRDEEIKNNANLK